MNRMHFSGMGLLCYCIDGVKGGNILHNRIKAIKLVKQKITQKPDFQDFSPSTLNKIRKKIYYF